MESKCKTYDLVILGAGAAGLMSAITAGKRGKKVLILEKSNKVGKKILMSGGGKSNFIGVVFRPKRFGKITRVGIGVSGHVQQPLVTGFGQQKIQRNGRVPLDEFDFSAVQGVDPVPKP